MHRCALPVLKLVSHLTRMVDIQRSSILCSSTIGLCFEFLFWDNNKFTTPFQLFVLLFFISCYNHKYLKTLHSHRPPRCAGSCTDRSPPRQTVRDPAGLHPAPPPRRRKAALCQDDPEAGRPAQPQRGALQTVPLALLPAGAQHAAHPAGVGGVRQRSLLEAAVERKLEKRKMEGAEY